MRKRTTKTRTTTAPRKKKTTTAIDGDAPDVHAAAARVIESDGTNPATERVRRFRERKKAAQAEAETREQEAAKPIEVSPGDVEAAAQLGDVVWSLTAPMFGLRRLDDSQKHRLGEALAPLVAKYLPMLGAWQYEAAALLCIFALVQECQMPREVAAEDVTDGEVSGHGAGVRGAADPTGGGTDAGSSGATVRRGRGHAS